MSVLSKLFRRRPEVRESYTDQVISRIMAHASGASGGSLLGVVETASRLWAAGLSSATISPVNRALSAVSPSFLSNVGRSLCRRGESVHLIDVRGGRVRLISCASWTVSGSDDPASWKYRVTLSGPSSTRTVTLDAASVVHCRYAPDPPWKGRCPLELAADTLRAAGLLESAVSEEFSFVQQQILSPRRNQNDYGLADSLSPDLIEKIVESFSSNTGSGALVIPGDLEPRRLGPSPPESFIGIRDGLEHSLLGAFGIQPSLVSATGTGTALRESLRHLLNTLLKPLGALVAEELQAKLDPAAALDFSALRAGDLTGTARAYGSLVTAGVAPRSAAAAVGLDVEVGPA